MKSIKSNLLFIFYTIILGSITGLIIWLFLRIMNLGINFLWQYLPSKFNFTFYTIIICLIGGIIIGLWKKKFGNYPEELNEVLSKVKKTKRYNYNNLFSLCTSALFPLLIGASVGPEAGLSGIIAALCTWVGDKLKKYFKDFKELTTIGITATLGTIFKSPMFGFIEPLESEEETKLPKTSKIILYFTAILSSFGIFILLNNIFNITLGFESIGTFEYKNINYLYIILLILIGIIMGFIYLISNKAIKLIFNKLSDNILLKCIIGSLILGIVGTILPLTMFSGESQISIILEYGKSIGIVILILTGIVKLILTNICIESGLKGGHFFPMIFAGIAIGYAFSIIFSINYILAMAVVTTSLLAFVLRKPIATVLLLMIIFPANLIPIMLGVAIISCYIKIPKSLI